MTSGAGDSVEALEYASADPAERRQARSNADAASCREPFVRQERALGSRFGALEGRCSGRRPPRRSARARRNPRARRSGRPRVERRPRRPGSAARSRSGRGSPTRAARAPPSPAAARAGRGRRSDESSSRATWEHAASLASRPGAFTAHRPPAAAERGRGDEPDVDARRPARVRAGSPTPGCRAVVHRPVDRVDDPARGRAVIALLLAVHALARARGCTRSRIATSAARSASVTGVRSGLVSTEVNARNRANRDRVGRVREREREREVGVRFTAPTLPRAPLRKRALPRAPGRRRRGGPRAVPTPAIRPRRVRWARPAPASRAG